MDNNTNNLSDNNTNKSNNLPHEEFKPKRDEKGRWIKGQTGNKVGGMRENRTRAFLKSIGINEIRNVAKMLYSQAVNHQDVKAAKLIFDHALKIQKLDLDINSPDAQINNVYSKSELENLIMLRYKDIQIEQEHQAREELAHEFHRQLEANLITLEKYNELIEKFCNGLNK